MLFKLLELLREGGTRRVADLARELDTTPELVETMLEELNRLGYLRRVGDRCSAVCEACPMAGSCAAGQGGNGQIWTFVES